ncbi:MAG TPA: glycoside hydrolase family 172 protein [Terriglobales bacterium]|nr:glycoside hydrolase family 172 protein [Terriglobales bacterium]
MCRTLLFAVMIALSLPSFAQDPSNWLASLPKQKDYVQKRASSYDRTGGNFDLRRLPAGETLTLLDDLGPGMITHIWMTLTDDNPDNLKALVLRMYWDGEASPSVEAPLGDFFGLGLGQYFLYHSIPLAVGPNRALNCFFTMPFNKRARITLTNESDHQVHAVFFNIDYQIYSHPLAGDMLYFHAQYRQATPAKGATNQWKSNDDPLADDRKNPSGEGNYTWMEARGRGHFVGVTMSVLQNQDDWWGEGDDMFFIDGSTTPSINGTGSEDYFLGAFGFGQTAFSYDLFGAPVKGGQLAGSRSSVYRFHLDSPIPFTKSIRATIEHGHANVRSDDYFSVAYWYQREPHMSFPPLPPLHERLPRLYPVGGPGNSQKLPD